MFAIRSISRARMCSNSMTSSASNCTTGWDAPPEAGVGVGVGVGVGDGVAIAVVVEAEPDADIDASPDVDAAVDPFVACFMTV